MLSADAELGQKPEAWAENISPVSLGQSVEFTEAVSETSSVCWRAIEFETESRSSMETSCDSSIYIPLSASPKLMTDMSDVQVRSGDMAEFSCAFDGQPFTRVMWDHNGQNLVNTERVKSSQSGGLLSLLIQSVGVLDQGLYRCTTTNKHGQSSCSAKLTVEGGLFLFFITPFLVHPIPPLLLLLVLFNISSKP